MLIRRKVRFVSACMALMLLFSNTAYAAKSISDLKEELTKKQKETQALKEQIKGKQQDKNAAAARRNELDVEIGGVQDDIDDVQDVIDEKQSEINAANSKIEGRLDFCGA